MKFIVQQATDGQWVVTLDGGECCICETLQDVIDVLGADGSEVVGVPGQPSSDDEYQWKVGDIGDTSNGCRYYVDEVNNHHVSACLLVEDGGEVGDSAPTLFYLNGQSVEYNFRLLQPEKRDA